MNWLERIRTHAAAKDGAWEDHPWEHTVYKIGKKIFVITGDEEATDSIRVTVKAAPEDLDFLLTLPFIERAAYVGRYGWITATLSNDEQLEQVLDLIDSSYEMVRGKGKRK